MKKKTFLVLLITLVLALVGCSGSKTSGGKKDESGKKDTLSKIKESGVINIGIEGDYPPFNYFDDKNELVGFDVDIANEIAKRMDVEINFVPTPWDTIIGGLLSNKYDIVLSSMAITEERKKKVDFTNPYYHTGAQLFIPNDNTVIKDPNTDIKGKNIGVAIGTTFEEKAEELGASTQTYKNDLLNFQDLANGRIDGIITNRTVGLRIIKENNYPFQSVGEILYDDIAGITVNKNQEELVNELNKHLEDMMNDGTYEKISIEWFGEDIR